MSKGDLIGQKAPDFELPADDGESWRLSDHTGNVIALLFYPQNETIVCNRQLCSVRERWNEYLDTGATVIGISPPANGGHADFRAKYKLPFRILADEDRIITRTYCEHPLFPLSFMRGVVIIDAEGHVRSRRTMLRAFRPSDDSVISAIYEARFDKANDRFRDLASRRSAPGKRKKNGS